MYVLALVHARGPVTHFQMHPEAVDYGRRGSFSEMSDWSFYGQIERLAETTMVVMDL